MFLIVGYFYVTPSDKYIDNKTLFLLSGAPSSIESLVCPIVAEVLKIKKDWIMTEDHVFLGSTGGIQGPNGEMQDLPMEKAKFYKIIVKIIEAGSSSCAIYYPISSEQNMIVDDLESIDFDVKIGQKIQGNIILKRSGIYQGILLSRISVLDK